MKKLISGTVLFVLISFAAQSISHFGINADHYSTIPFMRKEPIFILGILTMIIQGFVLSHLFILFSKNDFTVKNGALFGLLITALFVSYPALVEPAKYIVPSVSSWIPFASRSPICSGPLVGFCGSSFGPCSMPSTGCLSRSRLATSDCWNGPSSTGARFSSSLSGPSPSPWPEAGSCRGA